MDEARFDRAVAAIDAANADDPNTLVVGGVERRKEQAHAEMATAWIERLRPDADEALRLAARAHHVRRWEIPRADEPDGRQGYLRWKRRLQEHHAAVVSGILRDVGYPPEVVDRVASIVKKERLRSDPDVQSLEDALSLVFLETQLAELADKLDDDHLVDVLRKTLRKMTPAGHAAAASIRLGPREQGLLERAVATV